jgi:hypothetical protein
MGWQLKAEFRGGIQISGRIRDADEWGQESGPVWGAWRDLLKTEPILTQ